MNGAVALLAFVTLQRGLELVLARRNTARLMARGAVEIAPGHYPLILALHACWLASLWWFGASQPVSAPWLVAYVALQGLRVWILTSLGERWTTRIIILPGAPLVRRGPYRILRHPNYTLVVAEIAVLPMTLHLPWIAVAFSLLNALVLTVRIRAEGEALRPDRRSGAA
jgi:methyltransferase